MSTLTSVLNLLAVFLSVFGTLILAALGLAIIFGMMGIINLAHGEFIMIGALLTAISYHVGVPLVLAILLGGLGTGIFGVIVERVVIQHMYDRVIDSMVVTWGIGIIMSQAVLIIFGSRYAGIPTPFGSLSYGSFSMSAYRLVLPIVALLLLVALYLIYMYTSFGMRARATMQDAQTARNLGVDTRRVYAKSFFLGSVAAGLAGGIFAPIISITPTLGQSYIVEAFVTVIVAGPAVLAGTSISAGFLAGINAPINHAYGTFAARVGLLLAAILILRFLPQGISGYWSDTGGLRE